MRTSVAPVLFSLIALLALSAFAAAAGQELVFVGSGKKDIEAFRFDPGTGALTSLGQAAAIAHPSFLTIAPNHRFLYAITEGGRPDDSSVSAFSIDPASGKLTLLNSQPAGGGAGPCHVEVDASGGLSTVGQRGAWSGFGLRPGQRFERQSATAGRAARALHRHRPA
jgi:6-phosphogluconolactonase